MSQICKVVITWVTENIVEPVEKWISQQQQHCKKWPWPLNLICNWVAVIVKVIVMVAKTITKEVSTVVCRMITFAIGSVLMIFAVVIDILCPRCSVSSWVKYWFISPGKVKYKSKTPSPNYPGYFDYAFDCGCKANGGPEVVVTATNDDDAAAQVKEACKKLC